MKRLRWFACVVLALAVVVSVVYATGAFTSMTASRSVDIQVTGDGSAFLSLQPSDGPNGKFASYGPNGALQVRIGGAGGPSTASGVNPDSKTVFRNVFIITNKGSQPVSVWFSGGSPAVTFISPDGTSFETKSGAVTIRPGGRSLHVGLVIDSRGVKPGANLLESVTIHTATDFGGQSVGSMIDSTAGTGPGVNDARSSPVEMAADNGVSDGPFGNGDGGSCGLNLFCDLTLGDRHSGPSAVSGSGIPVDTLRTELRKIGEPLLRGMRELGERMWEGVKPVLTMIQEWWENHPWVRRSLLVTMLASSDPSSASDSGRPVCPGSKYEYFQVGQPAMYIDDAETGTEEKYWPAGTGDGIQGGALTDPQTGGGYCVEKDYNPLKKTPESVKTAGVAFVVLFPVDGMGPADEAAGAAWVAKKAAPYVVKGVRIGAKKVAQGAAVIGSVLFAGGQTDEQTKERETEETQGTEGDHGQQETEETTQGDGNSDPDPPWRTLTRLLDEFAELLDDDRPPGYDALREQGVPEATIEDWHEKGYDLEEISDEIDEYYERIEDAESVIPSVYQYTTGENDLSNKQVYDVLEAYAEADDVELLPGNKGPKAVQNWIDYLDRRGVDGVRDMLRGVQGNEKGYKQIAGESYIAYSLLKNSGISPDDIHMQVDIPSEDVPNDLEKDSSEIDVYVDSKATIEGVTLDSPTIESKHWGSGYNDFLADIEIDRLEKKLAAQAAAGQDEIVVVVTEEFMSEHGNRLDDVESNVEERLDKNSHDSDVTIIITTYGKIGD